MRIALVITSLTVGGAEKVVVSLADALSERGHDILLIYVTGPLLVFPKNKKIPIIGLEITSPQQIFSAFIKLRNTLLKFKPDVVHSHMFHSNILARLMRLSMRIPRLICTAHSNNEGGRLRMLAYRVTDWLADISTNVSNEAVSTYIKRGAVKAGRMQVIHNGIDLNKFRFSVDMRINVRRDLKIKDDCKFILAVGRFDIAKDYPNLFHALNTLDTDVNYKVFIAGDGVLKKDMDRLVKRLGLDGVVEFLGIRDDVAELMSAADIFVLPSAWEGFGLVVAEAMACERIVVGTDCGGVKEVLGDAGYLVPPRSSQLLASALKVALSLGEEEASFLGKEARKRAEARYSLDAAVNKWLELYAPFN